MKRILMILLALGLAGCTFGGEKVKSYLEDPKSFFEDPLSVKHQQRLDDLERQYIRQQITYAQYLEQRRALQEEYAREVQHREAIILNE